MNLLLEAKSVTGVPPEPSKGGARGDRLGGIGTSHCDVLTGGDVWVSNS